jgi:hypothetical protein
VGAGHAALREAMGDELFDLRHQPDWRTKQQRDVDKAEVFQWPLALQARVDR